MVTIKGNFFLEQDKIALVPQSKITKYQNFMYWMGN